MEVSWFVVPVPESSVFLLLLLALIILPLLLPDGVSGADDEFADIAEDEELMLSLLAFALALFIPLILILAVPGLLGTLSWLPWVVEAVLSGSG